MPRATRRKASSPVAVPEETEISDPEPVVTDDAAEEAVDDEDMEDVGEDDGAPTQQNADGVATLRFKQALNWRAGRPIPVAELLRRLGALARELQGYEQDEVAVESLQTAAKELASSQLLAHKDKGVKALTASCVVDIFRLCAPNAPYTQQQMKDIFTLIVKEIFPVLADPSNAYNRQHIYVLRSLAEVKSIILLTDVPGSSTLIEHLFKECFDVLGGPSKSNSNQELSKNVEHHMTSLLSTLVDETEDLPSEVTHTILAQFLRTSARVSGGAGGKGKKAAPADELQGTLLLKEAPPAYNMAQNICNASQDKMTRHVTRYWSNVVSDASQAFRKTGSRPSLKKGGKRRAEFDDEDDEELDASEESADLEEIKKAHDLLRELWRATPNVLRDIIPLLENELAEENVQKRQLAVETVGDMIAGIGHAGPPSSHQLNPAAYPSQSLIDPSEKTKVYDFLTTPTSPIAFLTRYHSIYQAFLNRRHDKSNLVRAAWTTAVGRILLTSAGGVGLDIDEEQALSTAFANALMDVDEKVRHAAVKSIERFDYDDIVQKLGNQGGVDDDGSILANLAERVKDRKKDVRNDAIKLLGRLWGVASGTIGAGSERTEKLLGSIPTKILGTYFINDPEITIVVDRVLFASLLPLSYPPSKVSKPVTNGDSQKSGRRSQGGAQELNPDKLRVERLLLFIKSLDVERTRPAFFAFCKRQIMLAKYMSAFIEACEKYNGGVTDEDGDAKAVKDRLEMLIQVHQKLLPDGARAHDDMMKFAKAHDRRCYSLIKFCLAADSDYKKVKNAYIELTKKLDDVTGASPTFVENITILVLRASVLVYNRSHVQAIIEFSRSDENGLSAIAHEVLGQISKDKPDVFKAHVQELCKSLEAEAPTAKRANEVGAVQDLKACAQFGRQFPKDTPKDRKFIQALFGFINHGSPPEAAKYGAMIILVVGDKKQLYAKDIFKQCTEGFEYGKGNFLNRLAALSQLVLLGTEFLEAEDADTIVSIAINDVLTNEAATPAVAEGDEDPDWTDQPDDHCLAKKYAMQILVNRLRAFTDNNELDDAAKPVFQFINQLIAQQKGQTAPNSRSPAAHRSRMRLVAAQMMLKLCSEKHLSPRLSANAFNQLALVTMDSRPQVRRGFVEKIMKYMGQNKLSPKFFTPLFLLGHEPDAKIKNSVITWLKSRAAAMGSLEKSGNAMEATFARLLSCLAWHPDWPAADASAEDIDQTLQEMLIFILFYLQTVGTKDNLGLVYHVAQRVKGHQDGIVPGTQTDLLNTINERLYVLSDLAQKTIRHYADNMGWMVQVYAGKVRLPAGIFRSIGDVDKAREVAMKNFLPKDFEEGLEDEVRALLKSKKRKSGVQGSSQASKKLKTEAGERKIKKPKSAAPAKKTPKKSRTNRISSSDANVPSSEVRRSGRGQANKSYAEASSGEEDDDENEVNEEDADEDEGVADAEAEPSLVPEVDEQDDDESEDGVDGKQKDSPRPPAHSSPVRKQVSLRPTPRKVASPEATPKKSTRVAKQANGSAAKSPQKSAKKLPQVSNRPTKASKPKAKAAPAKASTPATRGLRASKRGKPAVDEFDLPESD